MIFEMFGSELGGGGGGEGVGRFHDDGVMCRASEGAGFSGTL